MILTEDFYFFYFHARHELNSTRETRHFSPAVQGEVSPERIGPLITLVSETLTTTNTWIPLDILLCLSQSLCFSLDIYPSQQKTLSICHGSGSLHHSGEPQGIQLRVKNTIRMCIVQNWNTMSRRRPPEMLPGHIEGIGGWSSWGKGLGLSAQAAISVTWPWTSGEMDGWNNN